MKVMFGIHPMIVALPEMDPRLRSEIDALSRATGHLLVVIHRYEMYLAVARSREFVDRINTTASAPGLNTIRGALAATLVISLAALFDHNQNATSLARVLNAMLSSRNRDAFAALHSKFLSPSDAEAARRGLTRLRSRLSRAPLSAAVERLRTHRHQEVAHLDINPRFPNGPALTGDIDLVFGFAANVVVKANRFCGLQTKTIDVRREAKAQALALCSSIRP